MTKKEPNTIVMTLKVLELGFEVHTANRPVRWCFGVHVFNCLQHTRMHLAVVVQICCGYTETVLVERHFIWYKQMWACLRRKEKIHVVLAGSGKRTHVKLFDAMAAIKVW